MNNQTIKKIAKFLKDINRDIKINRKSILNKILKILFLVFLLFTTKKYLIPKMKKGMMKSEIYEFINESVDKCLKKRTRYEQNKEFSNIKTNLPLVSLKMTLTTAVFSYTETDPTIVLKRVIINNKTPIYEDKIALRLDHENIVKSYQSEVTTFKDNSILWLTMEYLPIKILYANVKKNEKTIMEIGFDLFKGLEYLHSQNIAHLDLKIANIMGQVTKTGIKYKIIDFGYSRVVQEEVHIPNKNYGTFPYKPPEVVLKSIHGLKSDIWCAGAILLFLRLGQTPFYASDNKKRKDLYNKFLLGEYKMRYPTDISKELKDLIQACMQLDRYKRPSAKMILSHRFFKKDGFMFYENESSSYEYESTYYDSTDESVEIAY